MSLHRWNDVPEEKVTEKFSRKLVSGSRIMLAQVFLKKGCIVSPHRHENESPGQAQAWAKQDKVHTSIVATCKRCLVELQDCFWSLVDHGTAEKVESPFSLIIGRGESRERRHPSPPSQPR